MRTRFANAMGWVLRRYLRSPTVMIVLRRHPRLAKLPGRDGLLRSLLPNRGTRLVVRYDDAVRVLREDRGFGVPYLPKMLGLHAPFMLGLPRSTDHAHMRSAMREALYVEQAEAALRQASTRAAANALDGRKKIEVIGQLTEYVIGKSIGPYLGIRDLKPQDLERSKAVFRQIFINPFDLPFVREEAEDAARILRRLVEGEIEERRRHGGPNDGVIGRLLTAGGLDDAQISIQVVGVLVAWAASVPRGMAHAIDWLLDHPGALARARVAAADEDHDAMWGVLLEGLQARPPAPAVERNCDRAGRIDGLRVRCERDVMVVLTSAMQDPAFDAATADDGLRHLPFGYGMHQCLGRGISEVQMSAIAMELLRRPDVSRACPLKLDGPYPTRLEVTYGIPS